MSQIVQQSLAFIGLFCVCYFAGMVAVTVLAVLNERRIGTDLSNLGNSPELLHELLEKYSGSTRLAGLLLSVVGFSVYIVVM